MGQKEGKVCSFIRIKGEYSHDKIVPAVGAHAGFLHISKRHMITRDSHSAPGPRPTLLPDARKLRY